MTISVNGQDRQVPAGISLLELLELLQVNRRQVAVELNADLVPREDHGRHVLQAGDRLEIVTLVGGG